MERSEYRQIAERADKFFRKLRKVMFGLAAGTVAVAVVLALIFYVMGR